MSSSVLKICCFGWVCLFGIAYIFGALAVSTTARERDKHITQLFVTFIKAQLILLLFNVCMYRRIMGLFEPQVNLKTDEDLTGVLPAYSNRSKSRLLAPAVFAKPLLLLFLLLIHASWMFYYVLVKDDPHWLALVVFVSCAIYFHALFFMFIAMLVEGLAFVLRVRRDSTGVRRLLVDKNSHTLFALGLAVLLTTAGLVVTTQPPIVRDVSVRIKNLPDELQGFKIALLTDLHIGPTVGHWRVQRIVDITNMLKPGRCQVFNCYEFSLQFSTIFADVVAIAGDLVDGSVRLLKGAAAPLEKISSKYGTFFVTGNEWFTYKLAKKQ